MSNTKPLVRTCTMCGNEFITRCRNAKYCDGCRVVARKISGARYYAKLKAINDAKPKFTVYTCKRCGKTIKTHGTCTNRRICDACLTASGRCRDRVYLENRKDVIEEVCYG